LEHIELNQSIKQMDDTSVDVMLLRTSASVVGILTFELMVVKKRRAPKRID